MKKRTKNKQCCRERADVNDYVILLSITHPLMYITFNVNWYTAGRHAPRVHQVTLVIKQSQPAGDGEKLLTFEIDHNLNRFYHCLLAPNLPHRGHNDT